MWDASGKQWGKGWGNRRGNPGRWEGVPTRSLYESSHDRPQEVAQFRWKGSAQKCEQGQVHRSKGVVSYQPPGQQQKVQKSKYQKYQKPESKWCPKDAPSSSGEERLPVGAPVPQAERPHRGKGSQAEQQDQRRQVQLETVIDLTDDKTDKNADFWVPWEVYRDTGILPEDQVQVPVQAVQQDVLGHGVSIAVIPTLKNQQAKTWSARRLEVRRSMRNDVFARLGVKPHIDVFGDNNKDFVEAWGGRKGSAFAHNWREAGMLWLCPPVTELLATVQIVQFQKAKGILVFPDWKDYDWFDLVWFMVLKFHYYGPETKLYDVQDQQQPTWGSWVALIDGACSTVGEDDASADKDKNILMTEVKVQDNTSRRRRKRRRLLAEAIKQPQQQKTKQDKTKKEAP